MSEKRISPTEAYGLVKKQGYVYVDVRSVPEFELGHPESATNIPFLHFVEGTGLAPNPDFERVFAKAFRKEQKLIVGCKSGGRSQKAAAVLRNAGFETVVDVDGGYHGNDSQPGWEASGLPVAKQPAPGKTWAEVSKE